MKLQRKKKTDYVNNANFLKSIIEYKNAVKEAELNNKIKPIMPKYIGECILELCTRMSTRGNFSGYTKHWKDEMVNDAIINCFAAVENFNSDKFTNPFGYFSRVAWNAFILRIKEEKREQYVKHKNLDNLILFGESFVDDSDKEAHFNIIKQFEEKLDNKKTVVRDS